MRAFLLAVLLGAASAALLPAHEARAWWDQWGRWHPRYVGPPVIVAPPPPVYVPVAPPPVYVPVAPPPYAVWVRPHYDRFGRFIPGHWG